MIQIKCNPRCSASMVIAKELSASVNITTTICISIKYVKELAYNKTFEYLYDHGINIQNYAIGTNIKSNAPPKKNYNKLPPSTAILTHFFSIKNFWNNISVGILRWHKKLSLLNFYIMNYLWYDFHSNFKTEESTSWFFI